MTDLRVRFAAPDAATLDRLLSAPVGGAAGGGIEARIFRDLYFDTAEADLERRGAWALVRVAQDGSSRLVVEAPPASGHEPAAAPGAAILRPLEPAGGLDPRPLFAGDTDAARMLRAMLDPGRLVPYMEVETHRRERRIEAERGPITLLCDSMVGREGEVSTELHEVEVILPGEGKGRRKLLRALEAEHGLEPVTEPVARRVRRGLAEEAIDWLEEAVRSARRVAVVAYGDGLVALRHDGRLLRVPAGEGTGEEAARRVLREAWGQGAAAIRLLGIGPGSQHRPSTEVWLAEGTRPLSSGAGMVSIPLAELLGSVGSPSLRDDATLAALHVLARSDLPAQPGVRASHPLLPAEAPIDAPEPGAVELPDGALLNMELSTLAFNRRVLALAADPRTPLVERVRFLAIFSANLDEFFRVRVAGFKRQTSLGSEKRTLDGATPERQLDAIGVRARQLTASAYRILSEELLPALREHGVEVADPGVLTPEERAWLDEYYEAEVHAVLTPLIAGPGHPFPHIRNLRPAVAAILREPLTGAERLGVVEVPDGLPRFLPLPGGRRFLPLELLICAHLPRLYPGTGVEASAVFRVTRSAELHVRARAGEDVLHVVQEEVAQRPYRPVVRLEVETEMPARLRDLLLGELRYEAADRESALSDGDVYAVPRPIDLRALRELAVLEGEGLTYPPLQPAEPLPPTGTVLDAMREREWLVEFPRDSFESTVERFVLEAADDPDVLAIKLALYRTNRRSRIVEALRRASAAGKQVVALVELTARFDEASNIEWARYLRRHGIHVIYGVPGLKVHAKIALVVRREAGGVRRYAYVGTGNLNAQTATLYTDLGLLTADPELAADVAEVFNLLTSATGTPRLRHLLAAPSNMREGFLARIRREAEHARAGRGGHIRAKFNGLADREIVAALYEASAAGVRVELTVRSLCVLRPGVRGLSENIRVISVLGRHLEHARVFRFANGGEPEYFIGSADWRTRNLSKRVEAAAPVRHPEHRARLDALLEREWNAADAWELGADGTYYQRPALPPQRQSAA